MANIIAHSGIVRLNRHDLEKSKRAGERVNISMTGLLVLARDIPAALTEETIGRLAVRGVVRAPAAVKEVLKRKSGR